MRFDLDKAVTAAIAEKTDDPGEAEEIAALDEDADPRLMED